jgi:hypothetical protein
VIFHRGHGSPLRLTVCFVKASQHTAVPGASAKIAGVVLAYPSDAADDQTNWKSFPAHRTAAPKRSFSR